MSQRSFRGRRVFYTFLVLVVIAGAAFGVYSLIHNNATTSLHTVKKVGVSNSPVKENVSKGATTQKNPAGGGAVQSESIDTKGTASVNTPSSQWITSDSGNITVKQPLANAELTSGAVLSGSAKTATVDYRLIDNSTGVMTQGTLDVVNGNFSGTLNFSPTSSTGRLDVFSTDSRGVELNEIQIGVRF